ncbi:unnamed protein product, partial [Rotaria magnacalcarata]
VEIEEETNVEPFVQPESVSTEQKDDEAKIVSIEEQVSLVTDVEKEDETKVEPVLELQSVPIPKEQVSPVTDMGKEDETKVETRVEPESVSTEQKDDEA